MLLPRIDVVCEKAKDDREMKLRRLPMDPAMLPGGVWYSSASSNVFPFVEDEELQGGN